VTFSLWIDGGVSRVYVIDEEAKMIINTKNRKTGADDRHGAGCVGTGEGSRWTRRGLFWIVAFLFAASSFAATWRPVDPAELAQKTPRVDPAADAEAIFWDVRVDDSEATGGIVLKLYHYVRIKIFTERGKGAYSTVEIPVLGRRAISDVAGRTIKADGSIIELKKDAIFDREFARSKGLKLHGKSFALPNVEVGDIIEYQFRETRDDEIANYLRLYVQREIPVWSVAYHIKPLTSPFLPFSMRSMAFQCQHPPFRQEPNGFYVTEFANVPAFKSEPYMPPEDQLRAWLLIYYEENKKIDAGKFWKDVGKQDYAAFKPVLKVDGDVKRVASELVSGISDPGAQLRALESFCRTKIRNLSSSASHTTAEEWKTAKNIHSPGDVLKQKTGGGMQINFLFAALAIAAGFDARMARISDRGDTFFNPERPTTYFIENFSVAVKLADAWVFFDPATPYLEPGMLRWQEEDQSALISDPKEGFFVKTPVSGPERSKRQRKGVFQLREDGTLEGTVEYTYTGHDGRQMKVEFGNTTLAQQEEDWKESLKARLSTAEMSGFAVTNANEEYKPLTVRHNVSIPGYATRTGKRILFQPAFFQRSAPPRFPESDRKWDLYFQYGWSEEDEVTIELPSGWNLDQPVVHADATFGIPANTRFK
jgi:hypothetical protein